MDNFITRRNTRKVKVGKLYIGGDSGISIQSMTNTDTRDVHSTVEQIQRLKAAGCEIVRIAVPDMDAAKAVGEIKKNIDIPLVADIHFDYKLALRCIENGVDKIRINPGNIGGRDRVRQVVDAARERQIPIRIGVNSGSLEKHFIEKYNGITYQGMVESLMEHIKIFEDMGFNDIVISLKASSVPMTIAAYRRISEICSYPLHLGVTEAGTIYSGNIKSAVGLGCLLAEGIGDTIRVSLTSDPVDEIKSGLEILKALEIRKSGIEFISCPTCGRCQLDLISIATEIENKIKFIDKNIKVAVMGCAVNGPGEAKEADIGIAGGKNEALLFKKGKIIRKIPQDRIVEELVREIEMM